MAGHEGYLKILDEMRELHLKKAADYGSDKDVFENINSANDVGVEPWRGAILRANDKVKRIKQFCLKGHLENETVEDSLLDAAAYFLIALALRREFSEQMKAVARLNKLREEKSLSEQDVAELKAGREAAVARAESHS